ncbi:uncharacterized protein [Palaemon carinicauda]|uniref:uncharacterized protein n=1 Tax=Palaemon carinicauda TaxID=392227 RepID=UPI0035B57D43
MVVCKAELSTLTEELGRVKSFNSILQLLEEVFSSRVPEDPQPQPPPQGDQHQESSQSSRSHRQVRRCLDATSPFAVECHPTTLSQLLCQYIQVQCTSQSLQIFLLQYWYSTENLWEEVMKGLQVPEFSCKESVWL